MNGSLLRGVAIAGGILQPIQVLSQAYRPPTVIASTFR